MLNIRAICWPVRRDMASAIAHYEVLKKLSRLGLARLRDFCVDPPGRSALEEVQNAQGEIVDCFL